jgi:DNA-binding response OmpR family regulator
MKERILLVDDDVSIRRLLWQVLAGEEYEVISASSATEAIRLANEVPVDLLLLDLKLEGRSGWEALRRLTADNPWLPVIIITARPNQLSRALASGAGALLEKPFDIPSLLRTVRDLLSEPPETRLARTAGSAASFRYLPSGSQPG